MVDTLLQEVDDDLRADRMMLLWREWRKPLLYAAIALVVGTAGKSVWHHYREQKSQAAMQVMTTAREQYAGGDFFASAKGFAQLATQSSGELHDLALLWEARAELAADEKDKSAATLNALIAKPQGGNLAWRDLACLRLAGLSDTVPAACDGDVASPLRLERDEFRAARLWQQGKAAEARALLAAIAKDPDVTPGQRARVEDLLATIPAPAK